jgi:hypothetical protein
MNVDPLAELFDGLAAHFGRMTLAEFCAAVNDGAHTRFEFWHAVADTQFATVYDRCKNYREVATDPRMPQALRQQRLEELQYALQDTAHRLRTGATHLPRKRLRAGVVTKVTDAKVQKICHEINDTPDQCVIALSQLIGEALKWALWHKAKANGTKLTEKDGLDTLLGETVNKSYYTGNVAVRFLKEFKSNFMKTAYDMIRHSETFVPDVAVLNPQLEALEAVLAETFRPTYPAPPPSTRQYWAKALRQCRQVHCLVCGATPLPDCTLSLRPQRQQP